MELQNLAIGVQQGVGIARRQFLHLAAAAASLPILRPAWAQSYPSRPVRLIVGFAAGGVSDILARLIAQWLTERLGQPFVVENRPGAGSNLAAEAVVRSAPDGYTLLWLTVANAFNASLYDKLAFDLARDIAPVAGVNRTPGVMEVDPSFPADTVANFLAYAHANPGKISMATAGPGSAPHIYGELFKMMTGAKLIPVHYRGSAPALPDLITGRVQVMFDPIPSSIEYIRAGKLRPLAVTSGTRLEGLPGVPALAEFVPGYEANSWAGIAAPANTPAAIIDQLNKEITAASADATYKARLADLNAQAFTTSPADFGRHIANEIDKWAKVIKLAGIRAE